MMAITEKEARALQAYYNKDFYSKEDFMSLIKRVNEGLNNWETEYPALIPAPFALTENKKVFG